MPVEGVRNVRFEYQRMSLADRSTFDDRKILAEVMLAAGVAKRQRQISKRITALSYEAIGVLIEKRRTVEVVIGGQTAKRSIRVLGKAARRGWSKGRFVGDVEGHARCALVV